MRSYTHTIITDCAGDGNFKKLYKIFTATLCPTMNERIFMAFYHAPTLQHIDVTFIEEDGEVIGFCAAAFYKLDANNKIYIIGRAAIGILPAYQGGALPIKTLFYKFIRYKCQHPAANLVLTGYIANPMVYDMICKYSGWAYPKGGQPLPAKMATFHEVVVKSQTKAVAGKHPMVARLHFHVHMGSQVMQRVMRSTSRHVKAYLRMNPDYNGKYGLVVLVPVTWANIAVSICKLGWRSIKKYFKLKHA
jgi:hypothetical protein